MANVNEEPETETAKAGGVWHGASFEGRKGSYADANTEPAERQGQRRAGAPNALSLVLADRSIEGANCTSLPFRLGATFFASSGERATMRRTKPTSLTDNASANFPSAGVVVNAQQKTAISDTSAVMTERLLGDSHTWYSTAEGKIVLLYESRSTSATADLLTEAASRRGLLNQERVFEVGGDYGLRLKQLAHELLPVGLCETAERKTDSEILLSTSDRGLRDYVLGSKQDVSEAIENQSFQTVEVEMETDIYNETQDGVLQYWLFPLGLRDHLSRSGSKVHELQQNQRVEIETLDIEMETDNYAGSQEWGLRRSVLPLGQTFDEQQPLNDSVSVVTKAPVLSQHSGLGMIPAVWYPVEEGHSQICREVSLKPHLKMENIKRHFDSAGMVAVIKRARTMVTDEMLIINGVPAGTFSDVSHSALFAGQRRTEEGLHAADVSGDLARGMLFSLTDGVVSREWTSVPNEEETIPISAKRHYVDPIEWRQQIRAIEAMPGNDAEECRELSLCPSTAFPGALSDHGYCMKGVTFNIPGNSRDCQPSMSLTPLLPATTAWLAARGEHCQPHDLPECSSPESMDDEPVITTCRRAGEPSIYPDVQTGVAERCTFEGRSRAPGKSPLTVASGEPHCTSAVEIRRKAAVESRTNAVNEDACMPFCDARTEHADLSNSEGQAGSAKSPLRSSTRKYATIKSCPRLSFSGVGYPPVMFSSQWQETCTGSPFRAGQQGTCDERDSVCGQFPNVGQETRDTCPEQETPTCSNVLEMNDSSMSPTFSTQCRDEGFEVPCLQRSVSQTVDEDESFYDEKTAPPARYEAHQDKPSYEVASQSIYRDEDKENCHEVSLSNSHAEEGYRRKSLRTLNYPRTTASAPRGLAQSARLVRSSFQPSIDSYESEDDDGDFEDDRSCTLCSTSDEEHMDTTGSDVFEDEKYLSSCYSGSGSDLAAVPPLSDVTESPEEQRAHAKNVDDDSELFSSASSALTSPRKRKWGSVPSKSSESPIAVKVSRRYPVPGLNEAISLEPQDTERPNQHTECVLNKFELAQRSESVVCNRARVDIYSCSGAAQGSQESFPKCKNTPSAEAPFHGVIVSNKRTSGVSNTYADTKSFAGNPGIDINSPDLGTYGKPTGSVAPGRGLVSLVDYAQLTPEECCNSTPPRQQPREEPTRCLSEDYGRLKRSPEGKQVVTRTCKKVMEVYFDEDTKRFVVVPTSKACLVNSEAIAEKHLGGAAENIEAYASSDAAMPVELCKIRAVNEQVALDKSAVDAVDSSEDTMCPEEAHCKVPRKVRRIGLPKRYTGPGLHPKWKANADD